MLAHVLVDLIGRAGGGHSFGGGGSSGGGGSHFGGSSYGGGYYGGGGGYSSGGGVGGGASLLFILLFFGGFGLIVALIAMSAWRSARGAGGMGMAGPRGGGYVPGAGVPMGSQVNRSGYDDSQPVGVPQRFQGGALPGTDPTASGARGGGVEGGLAEIRAHDPGFNDQDFITRVERVFFIVEQAWSECKPEMARQVMADGIWQQHRAQIEGYVQRGQRNMLDQLAIGRCTIVNAHSDTTYDSITVAILAASADYDMDASGRIQRGNRDVNQWQEHWLFQRSSSAVTKPDGGIAEKHCPNCGAPLDLDLAGVCPYCKVPVLSGKYDWVLTRIDQVGV